MDGRAQATRTTQSLPTWQVIVAGCVEYQTAWDWQRRLVAERSAGQGQDTLLLLEHPPTITLGRGARREHVLMADDELARRGVALIESNRGGDVTYHAPGQLVGYPILKLSCYGGQVLGYLRQIEAVLIHTLAGYGMVAGRVEGLTGVWVSGCGQARATEPLASPDAPDHCGPWLQPDADIAKIAAIGVHLSASGVTSHGFALNVSPDLRGFDAIIPCGLRNRRVTSLEEILGTAPPLHEVAQRVVAGFAEVFGVTPIITTVPTTAAGCPEWKEGTSWSVSMSQ
ncbi:MAG: lipoyl(octanoyl) transferase LipB [Chloroflexaceae bacterium]|nr:lipoyl(octanoyl) transferase LipB [Chloroflexaceae bacterium]